MPGSRFVVELVLEWGEVELEVKEIGCRPCEGCLAAVWRCMDGREMAGRES